MNAKEKMEAYLENLNKMGTEEIDNLKKQYENFSLSYDMAMNNFFKLDELAYIDFEMNDEYTMLKKPVGDSNVYFKRIFSPMSIPTPTKEIPEVDKLAA